MAGQISFVELASFFARVPGALRRRAAERRHRKLMRKAPKFALGDMPENTFGKVIGVARPENRRLIEAPLSGRLCVYYEAYVDAMTGGSMLRTIATEQEGIAFVLEDGRARAVVDPAHAFMSTAIDHISQSSVFIQTDRQGAMLKRHDLTPSSKQVRYADGLRYREAIIEADERIAVFGGGVREPDPEAGSESYRGHDVATRLCLSGSERFPLYISDDPRVL